MVEQTNHLLSNCHSPFSLRRRKRVKGVKLILQLLSVLLIVPFAQSYGQWQKINGALGGIVRGFAVSGTNLVAGTDNGGILLSTNNGTNWTSANTGLSTAAINVFAVFGTNLFAGAWTAGVLRSTNSGASWTTVNSGIIYTDVYSLIVSGTNLFAGTDGGGVYRSTNNGTSWTAVNAGLTAGYKVNGLAVSGTNLFAGNYGGGVYRSTNAGTSWTAVNTGLASTYVYSLVSSGASLFVSVSGGNFLSTDGGMSWTAVYNGLTASVNTYAISGTSLFAGDNGGGGVFLSANNGASWIGVNAGLTNMYVHSLVVSGTYLLAGTNDGVWRRPLSDMITAVQENDGTAAARFSLSQNYPNPFNPATAIPFSLPSRSFVSLKIFDMAGREVSTLVAEELDAGNYIRHWNAAAMTSGIYFYHLSAVPSARRAFVPVENRDGQAAAFNETKRLILLK